MRIVIYARVSTDKQEKQNTIESQIQALREFSMKNNHVIVKEYIDNGVSGMILARPELDKLRDNIKEKLFEAVLVHSPDRLSRELVYLLLVKKELKENGIKLICLNRPEAEETPLEEALFGMQGVFAKLDLTQITERLRRGKLHKVKSGKIIGSKSPYGYNYIRGDRDKNINGYYKINLEEAKTVKMIYELFVNKKMSVRAITRELNLQEIPSREGKLWGKSSIYRILRNQIYTGRYIWNKTEINLPDLKLIDTETFNLAQAKHNSVTRKVIKYQYLLTGLVKCGNCLSSYYGNPCHEERYYRCSAKDNRKQCNAKLIRADKLENVVWNLLYETIKNPKLIIEQLNQLKEQQEKNDTTKEIESIERELINLQAQEKKLLDIYCQGVISIEDFKAKKNEIQQKFIKQNQAKEEMKAPDNLITEETIKEFCQGISEKLDSLDWQGKRYLLTQAFNKVLINDKEVRIKGIIPDGLQNTFLGCCVRPQLLPLMLFWPDIDL
jgi:site-specific DNA recombinase